MKPEYAACIAAIVLKGPVPQPDPDDQYGPAEQFIKICDPKTQTVVHAGWYPVKYTRGAARMRFILHKARHFGVMGGGEDHRLPDAGHMGFIDVEAERADPARPDETWWMQI